MARTWELPQIYINQWEMKRGSSSSSRGCALKVACSVAPAVITLTQVLIRIRVRLETLADSESSKRSKMTHHKVAAMKSTLLMLWLSKRSKVIVSNLSHLLVAAIKAHLSHRRVGKTRPLLDTATNKVAALIGISYKSKKKLTRVNERGTSAVR